MTRIELAQLVGIAMVVLALLILAGTAATILYRRRTDELAGWIAEQDEAARAHEAAMERRRSTLGTRAVVPPRPVSIDKDATRQLQAPVPPAPLDPVVQVGPADYVLQVPPCGNGHDHHAHYYIEYVETDDPSTPDMARRPCPGVRSGPHRRRV